MNVLEAIRVAFAQIRVQKLKSFFTAIGVTIGVTFLIAVVSIIQGLGHYMKDDAVGKLIALNSFELRRNPNINLGDVDEAEWRSWQRRPRITEDDLPAVEASLPPNVRYAVLGYDQLPIETRYGTPRRVEVNAVSGDWFAIKKMGVQEGRLISEQEYEMGTPVVVIGQEVKDHFFAGLDPIGREIRIGKLPYTVIGVADKQGSIFGLSLDKFVVAPYKSPAHHLVNVGHNIDAFIVQGFDDGSMRAAMENVRQVMRTRHKLHPSQPDNFSLQTSDSALEFWNKVQGILEIAGIALPAIGLLVGSIVIMNIMLVAVAERTREIGIRRALGARRSDILAQFLAESSALATVGAVSGIILGIGLAFLVHAVSPLPAVVSPLSIVLAVGVGAGVGIVAGVYPATRAARLDPIVALRQE